MNILRTLLALVLLGVSSLAMADPQDYTNVEFSLGRQGSIFLDGGYSWRLAGSYDLNDTFYTYGSFATTSFGNYQGSASGTTVKDDLFGVGIGMHSAIADSSDWVGRFALVHNKTNTNLPDEPTHTGYDIGTGFNTAITNGLELSAFLDHTTAGTDATSGLPVYITASSSTTILSAAVHFQVARSMDFGVTEEMNNYGQTNLFLSLRWDF